MNGTAVDIQYHMIAIVDKLMNHPIYSLSEHRQADNANAPAFQGICLACLPDHSRISCHALFQSVFEKCSNGFCSHSSGFPPYRKSCTQTGRMSGTRRSRPSSCCPSRCFCSMSLHVSSPYILLIKIKYITNRPVLRDKAVRNYIICFSHVQALKKSILQT